MGDPENEEPGRPAEGENPVRAFLADERKDARDRGEHFAEIARVEEARVADFDTVEAGRVRLARIPAEESDGETTSGEFFCQESDLQFRAAGSALRRFVEDEVSVAREESDFQGVRKKAEAGEVKRKKRLGQRLRCYRKSQPDGNVFE